MNRIPKAPMSPMPRESGFSLVELMIALTISLFLIASVGYVFLGAKTSFNSLNGLSRIQENARYAFEFMGKDIRMTGFSGGPGPDDDGVIMGAPVNVLNTPTWDPNLKDLYGTPLRGYEQDTVVPDVTPLAGTDAVTIVHADSDNEYGVSSRDPVASTFTLDFTTCPTSGLPQQGEIFVASDHTHSAVFQISSATSCSGGAMTVTHATGTVSPGNSSIELGAFNGGVAEAIKLYRLKAATYYIATNPSGEPALYRLALGHSGVSATPTAEELLEGVENMQIEYGEDAVADTAKEVTVYRTADEVANWNKVYSVRITLSMVSQQGLRIAQSGDGLLRKSFTNTIAVRNRLQ